MHILSSAKLSKLPVFYAYWNGDTFVITF